MLQAFLAVVHFGMNVQQAVEAATVTSTAFAASNYPHRVCSIADQFGNLVSVTPPGRPAHLFSFDLRDRESQYTGEESFNYVCRFATCQT